MGEIFLYRRESGINPQQLQKLRREGFIPVGVEYLSDATLLAAPVPVSQARMDLILVAALKAFGDCSDYASTQFGKRVAEALLATPSQPPVQP